MRCDALSAFYNLLIINYRIASLIFFNKDMYILNDSCSSPVMLVAVKSFTYLCYKNCKDTYHNIFFTGLSLFIRIDHVILNTTFVSGFILLHTATIYNYPLDGLQILALCPKWNNNIFWTDYWFIYVYGLQYVALNVVLLTFQIGKAFWLTGGTCKFIIIFCTLLSLVFLLLHWLYNGSLHCCSSYFLHIFFCWVNFFSWCKIWVLLGLRVFSGSLLNISISQWNLLLLLARCSGIRSVLRDMEMFDNLLDPLLFSWNNALGFWSFLFILLAMIEVLSWFLVAALSACYFGISNVKSQLDFPLFIKVWCSKVVKPW